jgi:hypothetical protein
MTEGTDAPQGGAEDLSSAVETISDATTGQQQDGAESQSSADDAGAEPKPKQVPWFQKRIDEVTASKYEAQREAAYWRGLAEASKQQAVATPAEPVGPPTLEQFDYDEAKFRNAVADYSTEQARKAVREELSAAETAKAQQSQQHTAMEKLTKGAEKHSDFAAIVSDIAITDATRALLVDDPNAADVLYELAKSGDVRAFNQLPPYRQAIELGKVAARIESPKASSPKPIPPNPPQTVTGASAGLTRDPANMSMAEYAAARKAGQI